MTFCENDYLSWYLPRIARDDGSINLHSSGVPPVDPSELSVPDGSPMEMASRLEAALGEWLGVPAEEIVFTPGATGGTLLALLALAGPRDEIVVEKPIYEPMLRHAQRLGRVRRLERRFEDRWQIPLDAARDVVGDRTSVVMITEPHNPSGVRAPREQVLELARIAADRGATLLVNEVYRGFANAPSYHRAAENAVVVSSLSKLFGAYWARVGWLGAAPETARRLGRAHWNLGMPTQPGAAAGLAFLEGAASRRERAIALALSGAHIVGSWVRTTPGLSWHPPDGTGFGCARLPDGIDDVTLAERTHAERGALLVPGTCLEAPGTVRISWLNAGKRLEEGLDAVAGAIASLAE